MNGNIGLIYYRKVHNYGKGLEESKKQFKAEQEAFNIKTNTSFTLKTIYPGLLVGTGYPHPVSEKVQKDDDTKGDFQNGFYFDYTTGLPIIPASSIKGTLRSYFPSIDVPMFKNKKYKDERYEFIQDILKNEIKDKISLSKEQIKQLELEIFEGLDTNGKSKSIYKRDRFFDAYLDFKDSKQIFAEDYITPHKNRKNLTFKDGTLVPDEMCEPNPIKILKIRGDIQFKFQFLLQDGIITADQKTQLFEYLIKDFGLGAKTNVGYGKFQE